MSSKLPGTSRKGTWIYLSRRQEPAVSDVIISYMIQCLRNSFLWQNCGRGTEGAKTRGWFKRSSEQ